MLQRRGGDGLPALRAGLHRGMQLGRGCPGGHPCSFQPEGSGRVEDARFGKPQLGMPHGGVDQKNELTVPDVGQPAVPGQRGGQVGPQLPVQRLQLQGTVQRMACLVRHQCLQRLAGHGRGAVAGLVLGHETNMAFHKKIVIKSRVNGRGDGLLARLAELADQRPRAVLGATLGAGLLLGMGLMGGIGLVDNARLRHELARQEQALAQSHKASQAQVNALAARLGELQAQATRLNALGERLTQAGQLQDGEFDFSEPVGVGGGDEPVRDMPVEDLKQDMGALGQQLSASGRQLDVLSALLFDHQLEQNAVPSRAPVSNSYITSGFGRRVDPFGRGIGDHKGLDFHANVGDPVLSVADGVVSYAGVRNGYGNVVEVDHGNDYVTRYAHNSRLLVKVGDLVRAGQQVAKAGSSGRSTGAHVHFEVWKNGVAVNPRKFLGEGGNTPVARRGRA